MTIKGQRTFRHKTGDGCDEIFIVPRRNEVRIVARESWPDHEQGGAVLLCFPPAKARRIGQATIDAADIAEKEKP